VAGHIFQARPVWIYTQSNITNIKSYCLAQVQKSASFLFFNRYNFYET
jgi:hypothetical protein